MEAGPAAARPRRLPPQEVNCKWWLRGYCYRAADCFFKHDKALCGIEKPRAAEAVADATLDVLNETPAINACNPSPAPVSTVNEVEEAERCGVCLELPVTYGLLVECDHVFCLECIRSWRQSQKNDGSNSAYGDETNPNQTKTCPMCRKRSDFIIPSSFFPTPPTPPPRPPQGDGHASRPKNVAKEKIVGDYLAKLKKIPCRYFEEGVKRWREASVNDHSVKLRPVCYFGNECHYAHTDPVSSEAYIFSEVEISRMARQRKRRRSADYFIRSLREAVEQRNIGVIHGIGPSGDLRPVGFERAMPLGLGLFDEALMIQESLMAQELGVMRGMDVLDDDDFDFDPEDVDEDVWESCDEEDDFFFA